MAGKLCKIVGLPKAGEGMNVTQGVDREFANIEAEGGETMITKDDNSNAKQFVHIQGKKHSEGGVPLLAEEGTGVFSDKLKIKNPVILQSFGESGKKPKTYAQISKKFDPTKLQEELENENNDKIAKTSLEKSLENSFYKLSALFALQEMPKAEGHSSHFQPFMDRSQLSYDKIFGTEEQEPMPQEEEGVAQVMEASPAPNQMDNGGKITYKYRTKKNGDKVEYGTEVKELPEMDKGGVPHKHNPDGSHYKAGSTRYPRSDRYKKPGWTWQNEIRKNLGLEPLPETAIGNSTAMNKGAEELQTWFKDPANKNLMLDFAFNTSERPTAKTQRLLKAKGHSPANGKYFTNEEMRELFTNGDITSDLISEGLQDGLWTERGAHDVIIDVDKIDKALQMELENFGIDGPEGLKYLNKGDGKYEAYRVKPDGTIVKVEVDPDFVWDLEHMEDAAPTERNMDYRWDHKRALKEAVKSKYNIPYLRPFTPVADVKYVDQAYYDPTQAINAINSAVSTQGTKSAMFAPQQQQTANFLAGQQFETLANVIGQYEDKNVAAYNREQTANTQIYNAASNRLANAMESHHDKYTRLNQEYANSMDSANKNIAENEIAMWQERADRLNLEATIGEQYAKDPNTGIHEFIKGKDYSATTGTTKSLTDRYRELMKEPGMTPSVAADLAKAEFSGNYSIQRKEYPEDNKSSGTI